jgi:hypothetical protein
MRRPGLMKPSGHHHADPRTRGASAIMERRIGGCRRELLDQTLDSTLSL